ncbi:MAG: TatD family hydrolase [Varibaculum sp.]|nr:TatD family hydrolase [Varibaculum sp.]
MSKRKPKYWPPVPEPLTAPVVDNHTHLALRPEQIPSPQGERLSVTEQLARAVQVGVRAVISSGCQFDELAGTVSLALDIKGSQIELPQVYAALAIHPNEAALHRGISDPSPDGLTPELEPRHRTSLEDAVAEVGRLALENPGVVVAIGESGLDYYRTADIGRLAQIESFKMHIELAKQLDLPLQIHDRDAHSDTVATLLEVGAPQRTVFHCFSGDVELAEVLAEHGWYASFAGPVSYPANTVLREALRAMPPELVLVETDAPYLSAQTWRGFPNASYLIAYTVRSIAETLEMPERETCEMLQLNTVSLYGLNIL